MLLFWPKITSTGILMSYMDGLRKQAQLFTLYFVPFITSYTFAIYFEWRTEPIVLDANCMINILSSILTFIFIGPFWLKLFNE